MCLFFKFERDALLSNFHLIIISDFQFYSYHTFIICYISNNQTLLDLSTVKLLVIVKMLVCFHVHMFVALLLSIVCGFKPLVIVKKLVCFHVHMCVALLFSIVYVFKYLVIVKMIVCFHVHMRVALLLSIVCVSN